MHMESYTYRKIKSKQAKLHKISLRDMYIYNKVNQQKGNGSLKIQDSSYRVREQEEKEFAIKKGNTGNFKEIAIFYFSSYILSYLYCIHMLHKNLQRLYN